jgi:hypothetical protein
MKFPLTVIVASDAHTDANNSARVFCCDIHIESSKVLADASPNGKDIQQLSVRVGICVVVLRSGTYMSYVVQIFHTCYEGQKANASHSLMLRRFDSRPKGDH